MQSLERNITQAFGQPGRHWLCHLPSMIKTLSAQWSLTDVQPVRTMNWNYVATAMQDETTPVVLKICFDKKRIALLAQALGLNFDDLLSWFFLRTLLAAQWFIEDQGDPDPMIVLVDSVYSLLRERGGDRVYPGW